MPEPVTNETIVERIEGVIASINRVARAVEIQNGRVTAIELARAEEKGARDAAVKVAEAAAHVVDRSRTWKLGIAVSLVGGISAASAVADVLSHYLFHH